MPKWNQAPIVEPSQPQTAQQPDRQQQEETPAWQQAPIEAEAQAPQYRTTENFRRVLREGGVEGPDFERLARTGITPGTATEFAAAHIQMRQREREEEGQDRLSTNEREAIHDLYKGLAGREDLSSQDFFAQQQEYERQSRNETLFGRAQNFGLNVMSSLAAPTTSVVGLASPETAADLREQQQAAYNPGGGASGFAGQVVGEGANVAGALALGPYGMAALYGGRGAGRTRTDIEQRRQQGEEISGGEEALAAGGIGAVEGASGLVGYHLFRGIGNAMSRMGTENVTRTGIRKAISEGTRAAGMVGSEAAEEAATELAVNKIAQETFDPERAVTEGVAEAFAMGGILAPVGGAVMSRAQGSGVDGSAHTLDQKLRDNIRQRMQRQVWGEEQVDPEIQQEEPIVDPSRLLPAPESAETQRARVDEEAAQQRAEAQQQPTSGQTILVDEQGRAMSQEQADALEQAGAQFAQRQRQQAETQPKALPAPRSRFVAGPEGVTDLTDPQAERRTEAPEGRQEVNALIEQGDIDAARQRIRELEAEIRTDPLTGEGNKRRLDEAGKKLEERAKRRKAGQPVIYADVDNLHTGNEVLGHEAMDTRMKDIARIVREEAGDKATVTRQGGDEFAIVWEGGQSQRKARQVARRVEERIGREKIAPGVSLGMSTGIGVVKPGGSFSDAYNTADAQATEAKRVGKIERGEAAGREEAMEATQQQSIEEAPPAPPLRLANDPKAEQRRRAHLKGVEQQRRKKKAKIADQEAKRKADAVAAEYKQKYRVGTKEPKKVQQVKPETAQRLAQAYENAEHNPDDPEVQASYAAFKQETLDQFNALKEAGYTFDLAPVDEVAEKYPDTASISQDLGQNQHLTINSDPGDMPSDHPLMEVAPDTGGLTYNQVFRAVHDLFGHARTGNELDILGEENAWRSHASMYSEKARGALATETRAQSNWVGYGPYGKQNQQKIKENDIGEVVFPDQKATLLPDTYWSAPGMTPLYQAEPAMSVTDGLKTRKQARKEMKKRVGSKTLQNIQITFDDIFASIAPRIRELSPTIFRRVKQMVFDAGVGEERALAQFERAMRPLHAEIDNWNTAHGRRVAAALQTDREQAKEMVSEEAAAAIDEAGQLLDTLRQRLIDAGIPVNEIPNFWPRVVRDLDGLQQYLGETEKGEIDRALASARRTKGRDLTHEEKIAVINNHFRGRGPVDPAKVGPRHTRARSIETITERMAELYQNPTQSALSYIRDMNKAIERAKFFGRGEVTMENLGDSVGVYVADAVARGELDPSQQDQLDTLIRALFTGDMARSGGGTRWIKQIAYFSYLTNFKSALTQLADAAGNVYLNGPTATMRGYGDALKKKGHARRMTMEELGLHDYGAEWDDVGKMAGVLDWGLRKHGFKRLDRLGKEAFANATKHRLKQAAANPNGRAAREMRRRYGDIFSEEEWSQLWHDIRQGNTTEQARFLTFLHLSNIQPTEVSETPVGYANNSNIFGNTAIQSRMLYTLKTFTMKRLDFIRRETIGEWRKGNKKRAARNAALLWMLWSAFEIPIDLFKDFMRGKLSWQELPDTAIDAMLGLVMANRYALDEVKEDPVAGVANWFTSAIGGGIVTDAWSDAYETATGESLSGNYDATPGMKLIRHTPLFGDSLYYLTPMGEGYHITNSQEQQRGRENMQQVREEAQAALRRGDNFQAYSLLNMYNDNKQLTGRKTNLTIRDLRRELNRETENPADQQGVR